MANRDFEQARLFLPKYLSPESQRQLFSELESFPENRGFYLAPGIVNHQLLQGDGWRGLVAIHFTTLERKAVSGVILSNSCDVDVDNNPHFPASVLFAPIVPLERVITLLRDLGKTPEQVDGIVTSIRRQTTSNIFYLPDSQFGAGENVIFMDDIHSHPLTDFMQSERSQLFRLNQYGFYILLLKLSIHFSRFNEGVARSA